MPNGTISFTCCGGEVELECPVEGSDPFIYNWTRWNASTSLDLAWGNGSEKYEFLENGTLVIYSASISDEGIYVCSVGNGVGEAEYTVVLHSDAGESLHSSFSRVHVYFLQFPLTLSILNRTLYSYSLMTMLMSPVRWRATPLQ